MIKIKKKELEKIIFDSLKEYRVADSLARQLTKAIMENLFIFTDENN